MPKGLIVRKLADKSQGHGPGEPWPFAGIAVQGDPPEECVLSTTFVSRGRAEGWITVENARPVHRPGGPPAAPWRITHTFEHMDAIVISTVDGDVRYRVVHQPDKYADPGDDITPVTDAVYAAGETRVDWFYGLELED